MRPAVPGVVPDGLPAAEIEFDAMISVNDAATKSSGSFFWFMLGNLLSAGTAVKQSWVRDLSLSSLRGRRGAGRGGSLFLSIPSLRLSPHSFLVGREGL